MGQIEKDTNEVKNDQDENEIKDSERRSNNCTLSYRVSTCHDIENIAAKAYKIVYTSIERFWFCATLKN